MLTGLQKAKALKQLKQLRLDKVGQTGLALAKSLKRMKQLRLTLGMNDAPTYSTDNPFAQYANDDPEVKQNADDWENRKPLTQENSQIITSWDSTKANALLTQISKEKNNLLAIYENYFNQHLKGKSVITKIGKVWINGETRKEIRKKMDQVKLLAVPYIPEILLAGAIGQEEVNRDLGNDNKPKKQKYLSFIPFTHTFKIEKGDVKIGIKAEIKVGRLTNGGILAYNLTAKEVGLDSIWDNKKSNSGFAQIERLTDAPSGYRTNQVGFDNITSQEEDEVNIDIIKIINLATGKPINADMALALLQIDNEPNPTELAQILTDLQAGASPMRLDFGWCFKKYADIKHSHC